MKEEGVNVVRSRRRDGTERVYYYHRPTNTRLPDDPEERRLELLRLNGKAPPDPSTVRGTLAWVIQEYRQSDAWSRLGQATRTEYSWHLDKLNEQFGDVPVAGIGRDGVKLLRKRLIEADQPFNAWHRLKKLKMVLNHARLELRLIDADPFEGVEIPSPPRRDSVWAPDEVEAFLQKADPHLRRAFMLASHTAQRPADCYRMTYDCVGQTLERDNRQVLWLMLRQAKTGKPVWVPLHPALQAEIATRLHGRSQLIAPSPEGKVWDKNNFARRFRWVRTAAGLPETLQFRDLRRTAMVRLAEGGATLAQIAAISGHSIEATQKILEHYVPRTRLMALAAMDLLVETGADRGLRRGFALLQGGPVGPGEAAAK